jgi:hypothetical protein
MASTRNKNTPGDYISEQRSITQHINYRTYHSYGVPQTTYLPGDGLLQGRVAPHQLSHNSSDIESFLWGIGSTNLVNPLPPTNPEIKQLKSLAVMDKIPVIVPGDLQVQPNQRYYRGM